MSRFMAISSTTRTWSAACRAAGASSTNRTSWRGAAPNGNSSQNTLPPLGLSWWPRQPPSNVASRAVRARPRPAPSVPLFASGPTRSRSRNRCRRSLAGMPGPVSATSIRRKEPSATGRSRSTMEPSLVSLTALPRDSTRSAAAAWVGHYLLPSAGSYSDAQRQALGLRGWADQAEAGCCDRQNVKLHGP